MIRIQWEKKDLVPNVILVILIGLSHKLLSFFNKINRNLINFSWLVYQDLLWIVK